EATPPHIGGMAAIDAGAENVTSHLIGLEGIQIANDNSPTQTVISGTDAALQKALERLKEKGIRGHRLAVSSGFHSSLVSSAEKPLENVLKSYTFKAPKLPV